jgi:hypothetical protein
MRALIAVALLAGCPKRDPEAMTRAEVDEAVLQAKVVELKTEAPIEERVRGPWMLDLTDADRAYFDACRAVLADPTVVESAIVGLSEEAAGWVRARADQAATAAFYEPVFQDPTRVVFMVRGSKHEWTAGGYVFRENPHVLTAIDDTHIALPFEGNALHVVFVDVDHIEVTDELGTLAWLIGRDGPVRLVRGV